MDGCTYCVYQALSLRSPSGSFGSFEGVGSLDTQSGSHSDEWADTDTSYSP